MFAALLHVVFAVTLITVAFVLFETIVEGAQLYRQISMELKQGEQRKVIRASKRVVGVQAEIPGRAPQLVRAVPAFTETYRQAA